MSIQKLLLKLLFVMNLHTCLQCPRDAELEDMKALYKSGEIPDQHTPITLDKIKAKLKQSGIFNEDEVQLNDREKKELKKLFETVEIMATSRNRQPQNAQNLFSALRMMERVLKKQLKEGQLSESLASKFHWEKLSGRVRRDTLSYYVDKKTNMRVFYYNLKND